ncbi:MAG: thioredoxin-disulfide reductase, partial [Syntrophomonas sp.]
SVPGIFAAGDIRSKMARQVATAVGDGALAGIAVTEYLKE